MAVVEVRVPDIGDFKDVEVIELLVKVGDTVAVEQSLLTVESDKASMEIPSSQAGVIRELKVKLGDKVSEGALVAMVEVSGAAAAAPSVPAAAPMNPPVTTPTPPAPPAPAPEPVVPAAAANMAGAASASTRVLVPDIGDFDEVAVIEVFVKPGDTVRVEQSLITVESDKASMEIPSSHAGVVQSVLVKLGDKVSQGTPIVELVGGAAARPAVGAAPPAPPAPVAAASPAPASTAPAAMPGAAVPASSAPASHQPGTTTGALPHASPSIRKLARELGVPLAEVKGSGPKGRITQGDVQAFVKGVMAGDLATAAQQARAPKPAAAAASGAMPGLLPWPQVDFTKFGPIERKELSRIKKISGANLHRNWVMIPHVTNHDDADITDLEAFRVQLNKENEKSGVKVTMLAFMIKASVAALKKFPEFNASLDGEHLVLKSYFHIGFAADTPNGLVVPVIKDADRKGILQISSEMSELAKKARDGKLGPADMSGGCFSISSLGGIGGRYFTPIINAPEVAIMGVCRSNLEPRWDGKAFQPRLMLPLSLSWDHRVIDGAAAARFNSYFAALMADFRRIALWSTVVVARKGRMVAIASDSLVTFGETRLPHGYETNAKMFTVGGSTIGTVGTTAHMPVLRQALAALPEEDRVLDSRDGLFETFRRLHPRLKEHYYLNSKEQDNDPYESSQFSVLVANASGIFGVESYREVFEFDRFWAIGSGRRFALGAMHAAYARARTAADVAEAGVLAGCEFDTSSAGPVRLVSMRLKG